MTKESDSLGQWKAAIAGGLAAVGLASLGATLKATYDYDGSILGEPTAASDTAQYRPEDLRRAQQFQKLTLVTISFAAGMGISEMLTPSSAPGGGPEVPADPAAIPQPARREDEA